MGFFMLNLLQMKMRIMGFLATETKKGETNLLTWVWMKEKKSLFSPQNRITHCVKIFFGNSASFHGAYHKGYHNYHILTCSWPSWPSVRLNRPPCIKGGLLCIIDITSACVSMAKISSDKEIPRCTKGTSKMRSFLATHFCHQHLLTLRNLSFLKNGPNYY